MKNILLFTIYFLLLNTISSQQYPLFTNYVLNDFGFNPAIAGTSIDYIDAKMTYRTQWTGIDDAPTTAIFSAQTALDSLPLGVGGYIFNDIAGKIRRTGFSAALCYGQDIGVGKLGIGVSGGFYSFRLGNDYFSANSSDPTLANAADGTWKPDLSLGVYFSTPKGLFIGASAPQILRNRINFGDSQNDVTTDLVPHYYGMAGYRLKVNDKISIEPSIFNKIYSSCSCSG